MPDAVMKRHLTETPQPIRRPLGPGAAAHAAYLPCAHYLEKLKRLPLKWRRTEPRATSQANP